jgi:hypothetical protein
MKNLTRTITETNKVVLNTLDRNQIIEIRLDFSVTGYNLSERSIR